MTQPDKSNSLHFRVPPEVEAEIRRRAAERDKTVSEYLRALAEGPPPDVRLAELRLARYQMALEAILCIGCYDSSRVEKIVRAALKGE